MIKYRVKGRRFLLPVARVFLSYLMKLLRLEETDAGNTTLLTSGFFSFMGSTITWIALALCRFCYYDAL